MAWKREDAAAVAGVWDMSAEEPRQYYGQDCLYADEVVR
jgi:hypothetical protein